jgi:pimeloyl-ACP methyl ester carboxylesterase
MRRSQCGGVRLRARMAPVRPSPEVIPAQATGPLSRWSPLGASARPEVGRRPARDPYAALNPRGKNLGLEQNDFAANADNGVRMASELVGEGPLLLLFHGNRGIWRAVDGVRLHRGAAREHQVILIDAHGHGHSEKPTTSSYAMERLVGDVIAVLDDCELAETAYLGYSMGGRVGFGLGDPGPPSVRAR